jgi:hypothetical protein
MNLKVIVVVGSLSLNAALAAVLVVRYATAETISQPKVEEATAPTVVNREPVASLSWQELAQTGDQELVARLRSEGFPADVIRRVVMARLDERFAARRRAFAAKIGPRPYWKGYSGPYSDALLDPELLAQRRALQKEYTDALQQVIGTYYSEYEMLWLRREYGDLPAAKISLVAAINNDYQELQSRVRGAIKLVEFPEDRLQLEYLETERRRDLAQILTPEEMMEYDFRASPTARNLHSQLASFEPSEAEYRAIFQAERAFEQQMGDRSLEADETRRLRHAQVQAVLSPERFADYKVKTSGSYRPLLALVTDLKLPETAIASAIGIQHDITLRADILRNDPSLANDQRNAQLAALSREATQRLTAVLGQDGFDSYRNIGNGWIGRLQPPATQPKQPTQE